MAKTRATLMLDQCISRLSRFVVKVQKDSVVTSAPALRPPWPQNDAQARNRSKFGQTLKANYVNKMCRTN